MTIGINGYEAIVPRFGFDHKTGLPNRVGSGVYTLELLKNLCNFDNKNAYRIYIPSFTSLTRSDIAGFAKIGLPFERKDWRYISEDKVGHWRPRPWTLLALSLRLFKDRNKIDVFFSPTHYLPFYVGKPSVVSILDISYLYFPELFKRKDLYQLKLWGGYSIKKASKIITISKSSKGDIIKYYKVPGDKVVVTYPGINIQKSEVRSQTMEELKNKFGISSAYILFVGTLQPRKNIVRLIDAFSRLNTQNSKLQLVIVGRKGWQYEEILAAPKKYGVEDKVLFLDSVADGELPSLYKNALCFILPSLYEGFGLPILEAMQCGCPVLTSKVSSLPEAGGEAALYFDPEDVDDIAKSLELIIQNLKLRQKLIEKGYEQVKKFSWEKTAKETLRVLQELGGKR